MTALVNKKAFQLNANHLLDDRRMVHIVNMSGGFLYCEGQGGLWLGLDWSLSSKVSCMRTSPPPNRQNDTHTTENITFPQLHWRAVKTFMAYWPLSCTFRAWFGRVFATCSVRSSTEDESPTTTTNGSSTPSVKSGSVTPYSRATSASTR